MRLFELSKDSKDKFASSCTVNKKVKKKISGGWEGEVTITCPTQTPIMNEPEYLMKNCGDRGGCYPSRP